MRDVVGGAYEKFRSTWPSEFAGGGLCMNPPERALVSYVDNKPQIQPMEGTAPRDALRPDQPQAASARYL